MLFKRRNKQPLLHRLRAAAWPRPGWRRSARYAAHRLSRLPATPYRIAAGFACGAAISFTPLIGMHFFGGALLAMLVRGNVLASALGTAVGNPWTFPFIWAWTFAFGRWLVGHAREIETLPQHLSMRYIFDNPNEVFFPMLVGSLPTAIVVWFGVFFAVQRLVSGYQRARRLRLLRSKRRAKLSRFRRGGGPRT
ncbi:DUF2062 domain-containing protein [Aquibaculum arenosum]|uniref:DUF2062 domain-containing protein n=1 Tax=Aquibaculum arenosum TaxID=3032591 RepID=A0ABT5YL49_9PROT|nr:DUF2062 domain-containing protein [Fodinicurvata sp. CAU 1616]MDF2094989.1 DUF2062 domain-containing protein [Fodinicurvata sp. CAU 1616]